jgi:hypothetical protein
MTHLMARSSRVAIAVIVASLTLLSCSILGLGDPSLDLALSFSDELTPPMQLQVTVDRHVFRLDTPSRRTVNVERSGTLSVAVLLLASGDTIAADSFTQKFDVGSSQWVHVSVGGVRPIGHCIGAVRALALDLPNPDSAWVIHGSIPNDAIC